MAEGIRIRHRVIRADPNLGPSVPVAIRDVTEEFDVPPGWVPPACSLCGRPEPGHADFVGDGTEKLNEGMHQHGIYPSPDEFKRLVAAGAKFRAYKTRHVIVDTEGYALVSQGVFEGLGHLDDHGGFELVNVITNPPAMTVTFGASNGAAPVKIHHKMQRPIVSNQPTSLN